MNKSDFLADLAVRLKHLNREEKEKFISYYSEIIEDYKEEGLKEEEAVIKVGSPEKIAGEIMAEKDSITITIPSTGSKIANGVLLVLGFPLWGSLLLVAVLMVLCAYLIVWCIPFITGILAVGTLVVSVVSFIGSFFLMVQSFSVGLVQLGLGIMVAGIAILSIIATLYLTKIITGVTKRMTKFIFRCFKKERVEINNEN